MHGAEQEEKGAEDRDLRHKIRLGPRRQSQNENSQRENQEPRESTELPKSQEAGASK